MNSIRYWWKLRGLQAAKRQIDADYRPKVKEAKYRDWNGHQELSSRWGFEAGLIDEDIGVLRTTRLLEIAARYSVPTPEVKAEDGTWYGSWTTGETGERYLTTEGAHQLRAAIRREQKERRDMWLPLVSAVAAFVSVLGAAVSLWSGISN